MQRGSAEWSQCFISRDGPPKDKELGHTKTLLACFSFVFVSYGV